MNRPRRQNKGDRLTNPGASPVQVQIDYGLAPFDRIARQMEDKWGIDRLPELVSIETADKYGRTIGRLNAAIDADNPDEVKRLAASAIRGLHAMDAEATAAGHTPDPEIWEIEHDGFRFAIIRDNRQWPELKRQRPDLVFYTETEVALALKQFGETGMIFEIKKHFPEAEIKSIDPIGTHTPPGFWEKGGDKIELL